MHFFLAKKIESKAISIHEIAETYRVKGNTLYKQYRDKISEYQSYYRSNIKAFTTERFVFPKNFGPRMGIDETGLFRGDLYTVVVNKDNRGKKGSLAAIIKGTSSEAVGKAIGDKVRIETLMNIQEITLDLSNSMDWIVRQIAPNAVKTYDRFHVEKLVYEALQSVRIRHRWEAIEEEESKPSRVYENGDSKKQLLSRSRYLLFKRSIYWTAEQALRARILFRLYPDIKKAYDLVNEFKETFIRPHDLAKLHLQDWNKKVQLAKIPELIVAARTILNHATGILNVIINGESNAAVENFNSKIKDLFYRIRGVNNKNMFFFRLFNLYA